MNNYAKQLRKYEAYKAKLRRTCKTSVEYEQKVKAITKKNKI